MRAFKKAIRGFLLLIMVVFSWFISEQKVAANENQQSAGFTVQSVQAESQVDLTKTFFYLKIEPDVPQTIQVKVRSTQVDPVTVNLQVNNAVSSPLGNINYADPNPKLDESLTQPISDFVTINGDQKEVTVENYEEKIVEYTIQPPAESFSGVKLGSLRFVRQDKVDGSASGVNNEYAYVIALMLTEDEERFDLGADLHLTDVDLKLANGRKIIGANIQNDQPKVLREMEIEGNVKRKGESEVLARNRMTDFSVAPNSNFDFRMPLDISDFPAGTYVFTGKATGNGKTWRWKREFTIGNEKATKINQETVFKLMIPAWVPWVAGGLVLALIGLIVYLVKRQGKWKEEGV